MVAIACYAIPKASLKVDEIGYIALIVTKEFSLFGYLCSFMVKPQELQIRH